MKSLLKPLSIILFLLFTSILVFASTQVTCKYCGAKGTSVSNLTSGACKNNKSGNGKHQAYEGSEKTPYTCKFCGATGTSISNLTWNLHESKRDYFVEAHVYESKLSKNILYRRKEFNPRIDEIKLSQDIRNVIKTPVLARTRINATGFGLGGVYKHFVVSGAKTVYFRIARNGSFNTELCGVLCSKIFDDYMPVTDSDINFMLNSTGDGRRACNVRFYPYLMPGNSLFPEFALLWNCSRDKLAKNKNTICNFDHIQRILARYESLQKYNLAPYGWWDFHFNQWIKSRQNEYWNSYLKIWEEKQKKYSLYRSKHFFPYAPNTINFTPKELYDMAWLDIDWKKYLGVRPCYSEREFRALSEILILLRKSLNIEKDIIDYEIQKFQLLCSSDSFLISVNEEDILVKNSLLRDLGLKIKETRASLVGTYSDSEKESINKLVHVLQQRIDNISLEKSKLELQKIHDVSDLRQRISEKESLIAAQKIALEKIQKEFNEEAKIFLDKGIPPYITDTQKRVIWMEYVCLEYRVKYYENVFTELFASKVPIKENLEALMTAEFERYNRIFMDDAKTEAYRINSLLEKYEKALADSGISQKRRVRLERDIAKQRTEKLRFHTDTELKEKRDAFNVSWKIFISENSVDTYSDFLEKQHAELQHLYKRMLTLRHNRSMSKIEITEAELHGFKRKLTDIIVLSTQATHMSFLSAMVIESDVRFNEQVRKWLFLQEKYEKRLKYLQQRVRQEETIVKQIEILRNIGISETEYPDSFFEKRTRSRSDTRIVIIDIHDQAQRQIKSLRTEFQRYKQFAINISENLSRERDIDKHRRVFINSCRELLIQKNNQLKGER